jgi:pyruvate dehydrogenase E1 component beta subunit
VAVITYREALRQALQEEMRRDERVFLMGEDIGSFEGAYKVTAGLYEEFGERRVRDAPIAELGFTGMGVGAAMMGLRPVIEIMTINFIQLAMDAIVNHASKIHYMFGGQSRVPMVIRGPGGSGQQLAEQHSQTLDVWFAYVPGLKVLAPATPADAKGLLKAAIRDDDPVVFIENLALYNTRGEVPEEEHLVAIGKATVQRPGRDLSIFAHSRMTLVALEAARRLAEENIDAEVVDLRSLRPLDRDTITASVRKTNRALVIDEGWLSYGTSAEIAATISEQAFDYLDAPVRRIGGAEVPTPYAKVLERATVPSVDEVVAGARELLGRAA